jgi:hypothetical protein
MIRSIGLAGGGLVMYLPPTDEVPSTHLEEACGVRLGHSASVYKPLLEMG